MTQQKRVQKPRTRVTKNTRTEAHKDQRARIDADTLKHDLDDILDEIDELIEENGEEMAMKYVQKGGE